MKTIRKSCFESNSSSSHSISISTDIRYERDTLKCVDGKVTIQLGEFGWGWDRHSDAETKASYVATALQNSDYDPLISAIQNEIGEDVEVVINGDGYIDHESCGISPTCAEDIREFIFNPNKILFIGNDNSCIPYEVIECDLWGKSRYRVNINSTVYYCNKLRRDYSSDEGLIQDYSLEHLVDDVIIPKSQSSHWRVDSESFDNVVDNMGGELLIISEKYDHKKHDFITVGNLKVSIEISERDAE